MIIKLLIQEFVTKIILIEKLNIKTKFWVVAFEF